jgi:hypothetical protein
MTTSNSMNIPARAGRTDFSFDSPELKAAGVGGVFMGDDPHGPLVWFQELPPNIVAPAHSHYTDYLTVVIEGSLRVGRKWYGPGSVRIQEAGSVYGPSLVGPDGLKVMVVFTDRLGMPDRFAKEVDRVANKAIIDMLGRFVRREIPAPDFAGAMSGDTLVNT